MTSPVTPRMEPAPRATGASRRGRPGRGRVLQATFGCNPNSSSLGVDVSFLLFGATFASALGIVLGSLLRRGGGPTDPASDSAAP